MPSFFPERKWQQMLISCLIRLLFLTFKQAQCAGGGPSTAAEVHGVTEANLDHLYTQMLLDTADESEFDQLHCRLSTFLLVHKISEIRHHTEQREKLKGWLNEAKRLEKRVDKGKKPAKKDGKEDTKRDTNILEFRARIEQFNKMQFDGTSCQWGELYALGGLYDMLYQVHQDKKDIGQLQRIKETEKERELRLRVNVGRFHRNALKQLVDEHYKSNIRGEFISRILSQHLKDTEKMLAMKMRLRLVVGDDCMFDHVELMEPIIFRIDLIDPAHLLRLFQRVLSLPVNDSNNERKHILYQIDIIQAVRIILNMKLGQEDEEIFIEKFQEYWKNNVFKVANNLRSILLKLVDFWNLHFRDPNSLPELKDLLLEEEKKSVLELFVMEKYGEKFKLFMDQKKGAKGRLIYMLGYAVDTHNFVRENEELARLAVRDPSDEELSDELLKIYVEWFSTNNMAGTQKVNLAADVLLQVRKLSNKFGTAADEWIPYRKMFFIFLDQLEDANIRFVQVFGPLYKQMLFKLKTLEVQGQVKFEALLNKEFEMLAEYSVAESKGSLSQVEVIELDQQAEKWMQNEHRQMIKNSEFGEQRLKRNLSPEARMKLDAFMKEEAGDSITSENAHASASASSSSSMAPVSSYYECPKPEEEQKTINPSDKGFDQFMTYKYFLIKRDETREKWVKKIDLYMAIWHYKKHIEEMLTSIENKFPENFTAFNILWRFTKQMEANKEEMLEEKLCKFFRFIHLFHEFLQRKIMESPEDELEKLMAEIQLIVEFPREGMITFLNADKLNCDTNDSSDIARKMIKKVNNKETHFHYLDFLLKEYEMFNVFFCAQKLLIKDILHQLLGAKLLDLLERSHPDVLKIRDFQDDVRFYLYEQFVNNRKDSAEASDAEYRLTLTLTLARLDVIEGLGAWHFFSELIHDAVKNKVKWLKQLIFGNPKELASARNICLLITFLDIVQKQCNKVGQKDQDITQIAQGSKVIANWKGKVCANQEYVGKIVVQQRIELFIHHEEFLCSHQERTCRLTQMPGHKTRIQRLVPGLNFQYDKISFAFDGFVRDQIEFALLADDEERREMHRLALNFVSWARWIWNDDARRKIILHKYDAIFDEYLSDLQGQFGLQLARMQAGLRNLIEKWRDSKVKSKEKWRKMVEKSFDEAMESSDESVNSRWKSKKNEFDLWLQHLNREEMLKQLNRKEILKELNQGTEEASLSDSEDKEYEMWQWHLKYELEEDKNVRKRLPTLFGRSRAEIEPILKSLEVDLDELGLIEESKDEEEDKQKKRPDSDVEALKEDAVEPHKTNHHGSKQSAMEAHEHTSVGSSRTKASSSSQTVPRTDKSDHLKISVISELKVKEKASGEQLEEYLMAEKEKRENEGNNASPSSASPNTTSIAPLTPKDDMRNRSKGRKKKIREKNENHAAFLKSREMELLDILREKGYLETPDPNQKIEPAIEEMKRIVHGWNNDAIFLVGGSYLLKLHTTHSDIDIVLLLPFEEKNADDWNELCQQQFFGYNAGTSNDEAEEIVCDLQSEERHCPNFSLYCTLCRNLHVTNLLRINGRDGVYMLLFKFHNFDFDIAFVPMSKAKLVEFYADSSENDNWELLFSSVEKFDILIACFIEWIGFNNNDNRKGMLLSLSGYRANLRIRDLLKGKPENVFQPALLALKLWAKKHFIYGGKFGLLNGSTLTTMLLYVFLKNSHDSTIPSLLENFFDIFYHWEWPELIELDKALEVNTKYEIYDWTINTELNQRANQLKVYEDENKFLMKERVLVWPVIVPGFPSQNAAFNVNGWTKQAILREFGQASIQIKILREQIGAKNKQPMETIKKKWAYWLNGGRFENKYDHFLAIICAANSAQQVGKFCDFVETRVRLQLLFAFGDLPQVQWMHASPEKVRNSASCPSGEEMARLPVEGHWLCTIWLVGVQLVKGMERDNNQQILENKLTKMNFTDESNEAAATIHETVEQSASNTNRNSRLENFSQKIYDSFKIKESSPIVVNSPRGLLQRNYSLPNYRGAGSPRGSAESPRGSPSSSSWSPRQQSTPAAFNRQNSMPVTLRQSMPAITTHPGSSLLSPPFTGTSHGSLGQILEGEAAVNEMVWAKYLDKAQLQAWLQEMTN